MAVLSTGVIQNCNFDLVNVGDTSLRRRIKLPERFDFVIKELYPHRASPVGRKDVHDAAAT